MSPWVLSTIALVAGVVACVPAGLRWLRVSQREHYLPGGLPTGSPQSQCGLGEMAGHAG